MIDETYMDSIFKQNISSPLFLLIQNSNTPIVYQSLSLINLLIKSPSTSVQIIRKGVVPVILKYTKALFPEDVFPYSLSSYRYSQLHQTAINRRETLITVDRLKLLKLSIKILYSVRKVASTNPWVEEHSRKVGTHLFLLKAVSYFQQFPILYSAAHDGFLLSAEGTAPTGILQKRVKKSEYCERKMTFLLCESVFEELRSKNEGLLRELMDAGIVSVPAWELRRCMNFFEKLVKYERQRMNKNKGEARKAGNGGEKKQKIPADLLVSEDDVLLSVMKSWSDNFLPQTLNACLVILSIISIAGIPSEYLEKSDPDKYPDSVYFYEKDLKEILEQLRNKFGPHPDIFIILPYFPNKFLSTLRADNDLLPLALLQTFRWHYMMIRLVPDSAFRSTIKDNCMILHLLDKTSFILGYIFMNVYADKNVWGNGALYNSSHNQQILSVDTLELLQPTRTRPEDMPALLARMSARFPLQLNDFMNVMSLSSHVYSADGTESTGRGTGPASSSSSTSFSFSSSSLSPYPLSSFASKSIAAVFMDTALKVRNLLEGKTVSK